MLIHGFISASRVNGPGLRAVVYFQGCTLGCPDCWNPESHAFAGNEWSIAGVAQQVVAADQEQALDGVTFSGGEPMQQAADLLALMKSLREQLPGLTFGMYSGYSEPELADGRYRCGSRLPQCVRQAMWQAIKSHLDFAVLGRYVGSRPGAMPLRTSSNQKLVLFSGQYREEDFGSQEVEVHIDIRGTVRLTGFPTVGMPV